MDYYREILKNKYDEIEDDLLREDLIEVMHGFKEKVIKEGFKLYRYSKADYYNIRNLEEGKMYLNKISNMNDVFEGIQLMRDISLFDEKNYKKLGEIAKIVCFSEKGGDVLMWGHYADSNKGMCVEYDLRYLPLDSQIWEYIYPVVYMNDRINAGISINECKTLLSKEENSPDLYETLPIYLLKSNAWSSEKEWRIVCVKSDDIYNNPLIEFPCIVTCMREIQSIRLYISEFKPNIQMVKSQH